MPCQGETSYHRGLRYRPAHLISQHMPPVLLEQSWAILAKLSATLAAGLILFVPEVHYPAAIRGQLTGTWARAWAGLVFLGGLTGLIGLLGSYWRVRFNGIVFWQIEAAGLVMLASGSIAYGLLVVGWFGSGGLFVSAMFGAWAAAGLLRALGIAVRMTVARHRIEAEQARLEDEPNQGQGGAR